MGWEDDDGIETTETMSDEEESSTEIPQCESLVMFDQLLHMTGISEINRNASPYTQDVNWTYIRRSVSTGCDDTVATTFMFC